MHRGRVLCRLMMSVKPSVVVFLVLGASLAVLAGCGEAGKIDVPKNDPTYRGAQLFAESCSGCHTLKAAGTTGSEGSERTAGPDFSFRSETADSVLFAIRNGGFGGGLMPGNIYVGEDAREVARFVAKWAGKGAPPQTEPRSPARTAGQANESGD